jgi:ABC-2 type transport system permease protein
MSTLSYSSYQTAIRSLSRPTGPWLTIRTTAGKGLRIAGRYIPNLIGNFVELSIRMAFFLLMANTVSYSRGADLGIDLGGRNLFIFFQGSLLLFVFTRSTLWGPINAVTSDLYNGTLEYLYSLPCSRYGYYVGTVVSDVIISMVVFVPLYIFLILYSQVSLINTLMILLACVMVLVSLTALGIMISLLALLWRQVGAIANVLGILFEMLAGAYMPVSAFPLPVQYLAYLLPYTWGYDLIRYYSFEGKWRTILPVWQEWAFIGAYAVLYTALSRYLLGKAERQAKRIGLNVI